MHSPLSNVIYETLALPERTKMASKIRTRPLDSSSTVASLEKTVERSGYGGESLRPGVTTKHIVNDLRRKKLKVRFSVENEEVQKNKPIRILDEQ